MSQGLHPLLQLEVPEILLNHVRHRHAQGGGEILDGHPALLVVVLKQL